MLNRSIVSLQGVSAASSLASSLLSCSALGDGSRGFAHVRLCHPGLEDMGKYEELLAQIKLGTQGHQVRDGSTHPSTLDLRATSA